MPLERLFDDGRKAARSSTVDQGNKLKARFPDAFSFDANGYRALRRSGITTLSACTGAAPSRTLMDASPSWISRAPIDPVNGDLAVTEYSQKNGNPAGRRLTTIAENLALSLPVTIDASGALLQPLSSERQIHRIPENRPKRTTFHDANCKSSCRGRAS
jgi:hypothetical protein